MKVIILKESFYYKPGDVVEVKKISGGVIHENNFIKEKDYITEELTKEDQKKIKDMIKAQLEILFWRLYTKSPFLVN